MLAGLGLAGLIDVPGKAVFVSMLLGRSVLAGVLLLEKALLCLGDLRGDGWMLFCGAMSDGIQRTHSESKFSVCAAVLRPVKRKRFSKTHKFLSQMRSRWESRF